MHTNKLMLIIAIGAGIMATFLAFAYIRSATARPEAEPKIEILFVVDDLPANHALIPNSDLRVGEIGTLTSPSLARSSVKADELDALQGRRISEPLPAGVPLLYSHLTTVMDLDLAPGTRAMSISVSSANMLGGMLVPGDRVDVIVSFQAENESGDPSLPDFDPNNPQAALGAVFAQALAQTTNPSSWEAKAILTNVPVIAIGTHLDLSRQQILGGGIGAGGGSSIITFQLTPVEALTLIKATAGGANPVTLLLRPKQSGSVDEAEEEGSIQEEGS